MIWNDKIMNLKKVIVTAAAAVVCLLSACTGRSNVEGGELINKARDNYVSLDSAKVIMTNTESGEAEQEFTFKYDEKDVLIFSYYGKGDDKEYAYYNDGYQSDMLNNGEYTHLTSDDKDFQKYVRKSTYPQADKGLILFEAGSVKEASVKEEDGVTHITHIYDADKISNSESKDKLKEFTAEYFFDKDEKLLYFVETSVLDNDGKEERYSYKIEITEENSVGSIENVVQKIREEKE